jgi:hypothetical protein
MGGYGLAEYPKLIGDVLVRNPFQEQAHRSALAVGAQVAKSADATHLGIVRTQILRLLAAKGADLCSGTLTPNVSRRPSAAAIRMRHSRERRRDKLRVIPFEIRDTEIGGLVTRGLLDPVARNDRNAVATALGKLFDAVPPERWPVPVVQ